METMVYIRCDDSDEYDKDKDLYDAMSQQFICRKDATSIYISSATFQKSNLIYFSRVLSMKRNITSLVLEKVVLPEDGSYYLGLAVIANPQLVELRLAWTILSQNGLVSLFQVLESSAVEKLTITQNVFDATVVAAINTMLVRNTTLAVLYFNHNELGDAEACALAVGLAEHPALIELHLDTNLHIGSEGGACIAEAVFALPNLAFLDLGNNRIGTAGAKRIAAALNQSTSLRALDLGNNKLGSLGCIALMEAMCHNTSVLKLTIYNSKIESDAVPSITQMIKTNRTMSEFTITFNPLTHDDLNACYDALACNGVITKLVTNHSPGKRWRFIKRNKLNLERKTKLLLDIMIDRCFQWLR